MSAPDPNAQVTIALDVRQPQAYLALDAAIALEASGVRVDWLPIAVAPLHPPPDAGPADDRSARHRRWRAEAIAREIATYADAQGLVIREYYRAPDVTPLHVAWLALRALRPERLVALLREAFRAYWALELEPSSEAEVDALLGAVGVRDPRLDAWRRDAGPAALAGVADALAGRGVSRAPAYLVGDEVFIGRQHLPMIRWILGGRAGPGPI